MNKNNIAIIIFSMVLLFFALRIIDYFYKISVGSPISPDSLSITLIGIVILIFFVWTVTTVEAFEQKQK